MTSRFDMRSHILAVVLNTLAAATLGLAQERVEHSAAGIALDRPAGWQSPTLADVQANRERVRLSDAQLQNALVTRSALPIIVLMKYPEPHAGLNPSVQVTLRPSLRGTPTQLLSGALLTMQRAFPDFRVVSPVQPSTISGRPAAHVRVAYTLPTQAGETFQVVSRLWLVPRGPLMFLIGMSGAPDGGDQSESEFAAVLRSIAIHD